MSEQQDNLTPDEQEQADFTLQPPINADPDAGFESFNTDPALEEQMIDPNAETRDQADAINQTLNPTGMMDTFNQPGAGNEDPGLNFGLPDMPAASPLVDAFDHAFPMRMLSFTSGTGGKWVERITSGTSMVDFTDGRFCSSLTSAPGAALVGLGETDFVSVEQIDPDGYHYPAIPSGVVDCYLTALVDGTFDGYLDAAKTLKIFAGQPGNAASKGFARLVGKNWRFVGLASGGSFGVYVTQNGGANGDDGSTTTIAFPTYTYDVFLDAAKTIQIGTAEAVEHHRPEQIAVHAGTHGIAQWNGSTLRLLFVDEYFDRDSCAAATIGFP